MQPELNVLQAMLHCSYKAWKLSKDPFITNTEAYLEAGIFAPDPVSLRAWQLSQSLPEMVKPNKSNQVKHDQKAQQLLKDTEELLSKTDPPTFYKITHCSECYFKNDCLKKLKDRDCISLLAGMTPKVRVKYHKKGITTITQLSHLYRPRRRRIASNATSSYSWELKALAIREQKTFILQDLQFEIAPISIYLDFEGMPSDNYQYLIGVFIIQEGSPDKYLSFWSDNKEQEETIFRQLFELLSEYPDAGIHHFGSYETKALKQIIKRYGNVYQEKWNTIKKRMVNLLGYLRLHIYPPTYGNGLKEVAGYIGFQWQDASADGFQSIFWRRQWEITGLFDWKEKLICYNHDDCKALYRLHQWFCQLAINVDPEKVQQVAQMKRHTPYKLQKNSDYGEDFLLISQAAYFDYQRSKIYWRNDTKKGTPAADSFSRKSKQSQKGAIVWQPKNVNEVIIAAPLKKCPHCGHSKLYQSKTIKTSVKQTDLKFTASGIRQHVVEYRTGSAKCAKCGMKTGNANLRIMHYGDNLFALVIHYYVNFHISNEMISKMIQEQYGIWISPMYLVMYKNKWWLRKWEPTVAYIKTIVLNSPVIHIDETTIKLARESGYVWVFATTHTVFYHYASTREVGFLQELLKDYKGIIVSDFYPGYETLNVKSQKCLIHLIRDLNDDLFRNPFDEEYKTMVTSFSKLLRKIIETIDKHGLQQKYLVKHITDTEYFFNEFVDHNHTSELAVKYVKRLKKHWEQLWTFLHYDNVPWNNNNAEAAVKAFAQHRRGVKGQMYVRGINDYLQMLSVAQTCRYRNISFLAFLRNKKGIWENIQPELLPRYLPFDQARLFVHQLKFERKAEWTAWRRKSRPSFIPCNPEVTYKDKGWIDWHDWIGFSFLPFAKARTFMRRLKLKNRDEYWAWLANDQRPRNIPYSPEIVYKHTGWIDLGDWLGTGNKGHQKKKMLTYNEAKIYVQALGLKTQQEYFKWRKSGDRPETIPSSPNIVYKEFEGWGKFLGTDRVANQKKEYWDYEEAKIFLKIFFIRSLDHFRQLCAAGAIPITIPKNPYAYYSKHDSWVSYEDFFGRQV
jgi:predicted RecB family nuclease